MMVDEEEIRVCQVLLQCTSEKGGDGVSPFTKTLSFPSPPRTVADVKARIEKECQIPESLQSILLGSVVLESSAALKPLRLRNKDALTVRYYSTAECEKLREGIDWIRGLLQTFTKCGLPKRWETPETLPEDVKVALESISIEDEDNFITRLAFNHFLPWLDPMVSANKAYFIHNNGLQNLLELHSRLLSHEWVVLPLELQVLQIQVLFALWNLAETFQLRRKILKHGGLENCIKSLVQVRIEPNLCELLNGEERSILCECVHASLGALSNLCELPETHLPVVTNRNAIDQLVNVATSNMFDIRTIQSVAVLLLVLSYTPETHSHLIQCGVVENMMHAQFLEGEYGYYQTGHESQPILMNYHRATMFAHLFLVSPNLLTSKQIILIGNCVSKFLANATTQELIEAEMKELYIWETFRPYIKLFYQPPKPLCSNSALSVNDIEVIHRDCLSVTLMALQNMLSRNNHRVILKREGLLDYVTCLPWHLSGDLAERGREMVRLFQSDPHIELQAPSLSNIAKAVVAKQFCGLDQVLKEPVLDLFRNLNT